MGFGIHGIDKASRPFFSFYLAFREYGLYIGRQRYFLFLQCGTSVLEVFNKPYTIAQKYIPLFNTETEQRKSLLTIPEVDVSPLVPFDFL